MYPRYHQCWRVNYSYYHSYYPWRVFHTSFSWWFFTVVWVTANLLKSLGLFLVFWPMLTILIMSCAYTTYLYGHNSLRISFHTQSCLVLYSFCANLLHSLIIWLITSFLSPHTLHLLLCIVYPYGIIIIIIIIIIILRHYIYIYIYIKKERGSVREWETRSKTGKTNHK